MFIVIRSHFIHIFILEIPRFDEEPCNVVVKVGETAIIDCVVRGESGNVRGESGVRGDCGDEISCEWYFEGRHISEQNSR